jgi:outer membrane receptor protein involved in Fe transport
VNLFNYWIRDAQRFEPITIPTPAGLPVGFANLFNVPRSRARGMEAELRWRPVETFSANLGIGLLHTRVTRTDVESAHFEHKEFNRSPHFSVTGGVDWKARRDLHLSAQLRRHGSYYSDGSNNPRNRVPASSIVDARAEYGAGPLKLFAQARNVFNALGLTSLGNSGLTASAEDSREILVGIDRRF